MINILHWVRFYKFEVILIGWFLLIGDIVSIFVMSVFWILKGIEAVTRINELIDQDDWNILFQFFSRAGVGNASEELAVHYHQLLRQAKKSKAKVA